MSTHSLTLSQVLNQQMKHIETKNTTKGKTIEKKKEDNSKNPICKDTHNTTSRTDIIYKTQVLQERVSTKTLIHTKNTLESPTSSIFTVAYISAKKNCGTKVE